MQLYMISNNNDLYKHLFNTKSISKYSTITRKCVMFKEGCPKYISKHSNITPVFKKRYRGYKDNY